MRLFIIDLNCLSVVLHNPVKLFEVMNDDYANYFRVTLEAASKVGRKLSSEYPAFRVIASISSMGI